MPESPDRTDDTLAAQLLAPDVFEPFARDCKKLLETQIRHKGMGFRTAVRVVQRLKPDILDRVVRELMPDVLRELEPIHADYRAGTGRDFEACLIANDERVVEALVQAADARARRIQSRTIHAAYERVRGRARPEIRPAVPAIAATIVRHMSAA